MEMRSRHRKARLWARWTAKATEVGWWWQLRGEKTVSPLPKSSVYEGSNQEESVHGVRYGFNFRDWRGNWWIRPWGAGRLRGPTS